MPYKTSEKRREYQRQYYIKHRDQVLKYQKEYGKGYYVRNRDKILDQQSNHYRTEEGKRNSVINSWKNLGIILQDEQDWKSVYYYVEACETCEECHKPFKTRFDRQLDHDHETGFIRDVVCISCNHRRGYRDASSK